MTTVNISLPQSLKAFLDEQVTARGYGSSSEYLRDLIRADQDCQNLRTMLLDGARSPTTAPAEAAYFDQLRDRITRG